MKLFIKALSKLHRADLLLRLFYSIKGFTQIKDLVGEAWKGREV